MSSSKGNATSSDIISYIFNATAMPTYGSASGTELWVSLHTANPGASGDQTTSETSYGSYARQSVSRDNTGWTVSGSSASNAAVITFPAVTSGTPTITHAVIGTDSSGAGQILYVGSLTSPLTLSAGIIPQFAIGQLVAQET